MAAQGGEGLAAARRPDGSRGLKCCEREAEEGRIRGAEGGEEGGEA